MVNFEPGATRFYENILNNYFYVVLMRKDLSGSYVKNANESLISYTYAINFGVALGSFRRGFFFVQNGSCGLILYCFGFFLFSVDKK